MKVKQEFVGSINDLVGKYFRLLEFTKKASKSSCCLLCDCLPCEATKILRELGE